MEDSGMKQQLSGIIEDIEHEMILFSKDLPKAHCMTSPSRRCRLGTVRLEKLFKNFRKTTCEVGLK